MRRTLVYIALIAFCIVRPIASAAEKDEKRPTPETQFRALYDELAAAIRNKDSIRFLGLLGSDFKLIEMDGKVHERAEMIDRHKQGVKTTRTIHSFVVKIEAITPLPNGDVAIIVSQRYDRDQVAADAPEKPRNVKTSTVLRDTWHQELAGWKLEKSEEILSGPAMLDGKWVAP